MKVIYLVILITFLFPTKDSFALSEYGTSCYRNKKCIKCKRDLNCTKCLHKCYNKFGNADSGKYFLPEDPVLACRKKRAKWCSAQCWDPDKDKKEPEYVSTIPRCSSKKNINK